MISFKISDFLPRRLSRDDAFAALGVKLSYPGESLSGVQPHDEAVVFAIPEADVMSDWNGSRCLLWTPSAPNWKNDPLLRERLAHCWLAEHCGIARGLLFTARAEVRRGQVLSLRVERHAGDYWGAWGSPAQVTRVPPMAFLAQPSLQRLAA